MIKLFAIGDVHIGKKFDNYPVIKEKLIQSRFDSVKRCVDEANREKCDFFVITGDLFDNNRNIKKQDIYQIVGILASFEGRVIIIPGNHDYYTGEEKLWSDFLATVDSNDNIKLVTEYSELTYDVGDEMISFYPAFCDAKHSDTNRLDWIKKSYMNSSTYNVGIAHGSLEGLSPDMKNEYFSMTESELISIPVDAWLIGHTHIPYPQCLTEDQKVKGYKIFNAGTPEQTDRSNNTEGFGFVISLSRGDENVEVSAHSFKSGMVHFYDLTLDASGLELRKAILNKVRDLPEQSIIRLTITGTVEEDEYGKRGAVYQELSQYFWNLEIVDSGLSERITPERIKSEFPEFGFAALFLESLEDPKEIQMAYELVKEFKD